MWYANFLQAGPPSIMGVVRLVSNKINKNINVTVTLQYLKDLAQASIDHTPLLWL